MGTRSALLTLFVTLPTFGAAQTGAVPMRAPAFETLTDSQWIRVFTRAHGSREAPLLAHSASELVLDARPAPLRLDAASIDSLWERRTASGRGALIGGLVGGVVGVLIATQAVEEGETAPADYVGLLGVGGAVGGGLLGALIGRAVPRWHRVYPP